MQIKVKPITLKEIQKTLLDLANIVIWSIMGPFIGMALYEEITGNTILSQTLMQFLEADGQAYTDAVVFVIGALLFGVALYGLSGLVWAIDNRKQILTKEFWMASKKKEASQ